MKIDNIYTGDCLELLPQLPDNYVDLVVTSPPYNLGEKGGDAKPVKYDVYQDCLSEEHYQDWQVEILHCLWRVVRPGGALFYNHKVRNKHHQAIHPMQWLLRTRWTLRQEIIWNRRGTVNHSSSYFYPVDERIYWLTKGTENVHFRNDGFSTVWAFNFSRHTAHPAPFPPELPRRCILTSSNPSDLVLDPFCGSGTTCFVAKQEDRHFLGFEISPAYAEAAVQRILC